MALTSTSLSAACGAEDLRIYLTSTSGLNAGDVIRVDDEYMFVVAIPASGTVDVRNRGFGGTRALAHGILAPVSFGPAADFVTLQPGAPGRAWDTVSYGADGAIAVPTRDTRVLLTKATAAAMTIAAPSVDSDGVRVIIYSPSSLAHTVTFTPGFYGNTTSSDVVTFTVTASVIGAIEMVAEKGAWRLLNMFNATVA